MPKKRAKKKATILQKYLDMSILWPKDSAKLWIIVAAWLVPSKSSAKNTLLLRFALTTSEYIAIKV